MRGCEEDAMAQQLVNVDEAVKGDVTVLRIKGKLDSNVAPSLEKRMCERLQEGISKFLLDLSDVSYVNSAGLRMLLSVKKQIRAMEGTLVVCAPRSEVLEVMKICGFDHVLEIAKTEEEALRRF